MSDAARDLYNRADQGAEIAALHEKIRKLRKINAALMDRVERSSDMAGNAFSMFETAISLEAMVRDRTAQLEDALSRLAKVNAELAGAHATADAAQMRLRDAIESVNEGFALFDADDRLVLCNEAYRGLWPEVADKAKEGTPFADIARIVAASGRMVGAAIAPDRWVSDRLARHSTADGGHVQALADGRWIQINELRTSEGGIVGIYTDITDVKAKDAQERARELGERNLVLQATLDNLTEGVCLFDVAGRLSAWNKALERLLGLSGEINQSIRTHAEFVDWCRGVFGMVDHGCLDWRGEDFERQSVQQLCIAGERRFEMRSTAMQRGGQVISLTEVTDMHRAQASLRDTAETLERRVAERTEALQTEITERRAIEAALMEAKTEAEKANLSKTSFLAAASHDLLQPLNAARLFVAALGDRRLALPTRALVSQTSTALDSVEDLLEALLEISRLDAGAIKPEINDFRIDKLLDTLLVEFRPTALSAGLKLSINAEPFWIKSDIRLLRRILQNFISNAIRYTQKGSVSVRTELRDNAVLISVIDSGCGIPEEKQALIFEEFRRLDTRQAGKGLGLAIVRRASDMLGHPVALQSAPGKGSTFAISVPLGEEIAESEEMHRGSGKDGSMHDLSILVVDNERAIQMGMRTLLSGWGCTVISAGSISEAIAQYPVGEQPDIILIDYHLKDDETGDRTLEDLNSYFGAKMPAIMISADRSEKLKAQMESQAIPLLNKPVKPAQLRALLRTMLH